MTRKQVSWLFLAIAVAGLLAAGAWFIFRPHQEGSGPADQTQSEFITVEAFYPGADAQVVADTVAAPIEQKINGVEGMLDMVSCSTNDGTYTLQIGFQPGTDLNVAQVMVQNRVDLAMPKLPEVVKMKGMTVKKRQPGVLAIVTLTAQDNRYSEAYLSNYANKEIRDELAHVEGVGDVVCIGPHGDGAERDGFAMLNGVPAVALVLWPLRAGHAKDVSAGLENSLAMLRKKLPEGMTLEMSCDFAPLLDAVKETTSADYLIVDVQLPDAASLERTRETLRRCDDLLRKTPGVKDVLSLSDNPFSLSRVRNCQVVRLTGDDKPVASIRDRLHQEMAEAAIQIRDLSGPRRFPYCAYPIDLAVYDTKDRGYAELQKAADDLAQQMGKNAKFADAASVFRASVPLVKLGKGRDIAGPRDIMRFNMYPMAEITANLAPGVSLDEARAECERLAHDTLPDGYRVGWLSR